MEYDGDKVNDKRTLDRTKKINLTGKNYFHSLNGYITCNIYRSHKKMLGPYYNCDAYQRRHVNPLVEAVVAVAREVNSRMTVKSGILTRTNLMEGILM